MSAAARGPAGTSDGSRRAFVTANTRVASPPHTPEIALQLADEAIALWERTEEELSAIGLPPPFWAFAWAGGQALARYILDHPEVVTGKRVVDVASGSGLVAIAAMKAGAAHCLASDIDPFAVAAISVNAELNGVAIEASAADLLAATTGSQAAGASGPAAVAGVGFTLDGVDLVVVGDVFYERDLAARALAFLERARSAGANVLVGDPGRSYLPRHALTEVACYEIAVTRALEDAEVKRTRVWRLA